MALASLLKRIQRDREEQLKHRFEGYAKEIELRAKEDRLIP